MSERQKTTTIGLFVIIAVFMLLGSIVVFGSGRFFRPTLSYKAYFESRLKGLNIGSAVMFRGVRIGSVTDIIVNVDPQSDTPTLPVIFEIEPDRIQNLSGGDRSIHYAGAAINRLIKEKGLRAHLEIDSIVTGQMVIELDYHEGSEPNYHSPRDGSVPQEFPTVQSPVEQLTASLREIPVSDIVASLQRVVEGIDRRVNDRRVDTMIDATVDSLNEIRVLSAKLNDELAPQLLDAISEVKSLSAHLRSETAPRLDKSLDRADALMDTTREEIPDTAEKLRKTLADVSTLSESASRALRAVRSAAADDSQLLTQLDSALREITAAARSIGQAADYLQRHPESLLRGKPAQ